MKLFARLLVFVAASTIGSWTSTYACEYPKPPTFEKVAPTARHIFVFRVLSLKVVRYASKEERFYDELEAVEGAISVEANIKGPQAVFEAVRFKNFVCGGVELQIGHRYLVATNQTGPVLSLVAGDRTFGNIDTEYWFPLRPIKSNPYVLAAESAVRGTRSFSKVLDDRARYDIYVDRAYIELPK